MYLTKGQRLKYANTNTNSSVIDIFQFYININDLDILPFALPA